MASNQLLLSPSRSRAAPQKMTFERYVSIFLNNTMRGLMRQYGLKPDQIAPPFVLRYLLQGAFIGQITLHEVKRYLVNRCEAMQ